MSYKQLLSRLSIFVLGVALNWVVIATDPKATSEKHELHAAQPKVGILVNNARLWGLLIFLYIILMVAYKVHEDNLPDLERDSILYAKFLVSEKEIQKEKLN